MLEKLMLTDKENEILTKGIATGVGIGFLLGIFFNNVQFTFALGGVGGIVVSLIYCYYRRYKEKAKAFMNI